MLLIRGREKAAQFPIIQHNRSTLKHWMVFDLDCDDAHFVPEDRGMPVPTFTAINRSNGHAHIGYQLECPVSFYDSSSQRPVKYYDAVVRGFTHRLGADRGYMGFLSKNPLSPSWETLWQAKTPYTLDRLNDYLEPSDKRISRTQPSAIGRNVEVFDSIRQVAYREVLKFKKRGDGEEVFREYLRKAAEEVNRGFLPLCLGGAEIRCLARSVSKYTWKHFTHEKFSAIQAARGKRRWLKVETLTKTKPWETQGISRSTWYDRRASGHPKAALI